MNLTEQQYQTPSYVLGNDQIFTSKNSSTQYYVLKGAKFESTSDPSVVSVKNADVNINKSNTETSNWTKDGKHNVSYYCKLGQFFFSGNDKKAFTNQTVANQLKSLCGKVNYQSQNAKAGKTYIQKNDQSFGSFGDPNHFVFSIIKGSTWTWDGKNAVTKNTTSGGIQTSGIGQGFEGEKIGNPIFSCVPTKKGEYITVLGKPYVEISDSKTLVKNLRQQFCFSKTQNSGNDDKVNTPTNSKSNFTALYTIQNQHDLGPVKVNVGDTIIKSTKYPDYAAIMRVNTPIAYYNCKTNAWNDIQISDTKGALTGTIKEKVCPQVLTTTPVVDPNNPNAQQVVGTNAQQTVTPNAQQAVTPNTQQVNRQQQFAQRTVTAINNVQKTLGVTQPNGQLKNSDIEDLLNKLK